MFDRFRSGSDGSCEGHHYGEWEPEFPPIIEIEQDVGQPGFKYSISIEHTRRCEHYGCFDTQTKMVVMNTVMREELDEIIDEVIGWGDETEKEDWGDE